MPALAQLGAMTATIGGALGLVIGSFLNVVVYRVPAGLSVVSPASACPRCEHPIRGYDNVPILSWVVLRGRCRDCRAPIPVRYPLVELATGVLFLAVTAFFVPQLVGTGTVLAGHIVALVAYLFLMAISIVLTLVDLDTHRLPNAVVLPAYPVLVVLLGASSALTGDWAAFVRALTGMVGLGVGYLALALAVPGGMGFGDVKLAGVLGFALAYLGWGPLAVGAFGAFLLGGMFAVGLLLTHRAGRKNGIPFGPWMLGGAWIGIAVGAPVWAAYLRILGVV